MIQEYFHYHSASQGDIIIHAFWDETKRPLFDKLAACRGGGMLGKFNALKASFKYNHWRPDRSNLEYLRSFLTSGAKDKVISEMTVDIEAAKKVKEGEALFIREHPGHPDLQHHRDERSLAEDAHYHLKGIRYVLQHWEYQLI